MSAPSHSTASANYNRINLFSSITWENIKTLKHKPSLKEATLRILLCENFPEVETNNRSSQKKSVVKEMPVLFHYFFTNFLSILWCKTVSNICSIFSFPVPTRHFVTNYRNNLSCISAYTETRDTRAKWCYWYYRSILYWLGILETLTGIFFPFKLHTYKKTLK